MHVCVCVVYSADCINCVCVCVCVDMQTALYELCWQVVQGNLKLDLAASVLGDMMVNIKLTVAADRPILPFLPFHTYCLVLHGSSLYMFGIFQWWYLFLDLYFLLWYPCVGSGINQHLNLESPSSNVKVNYWYAYRNSERTWPPYWQMSSAYWVSSLAMLIKYNLHQK